MSTAMLYWFGWHPQAVLVVYAGASALQILVEARQRQEDAPAGATAAFLRQK